MKNASLINYLQLFLLLLFLNACSKKPEADFTFTYNSPIEVQFTDNSKNASSYRWDFGDGDFSYDKAPIKRYLASGSYHVTLEAKENGKSSSITKTVEIKSTKCYVTKLIIDSIGLLNSSMDLYYTMAVQNGNFLQSSIKHWDDLLGYPISNYFFWEYPNKSSQFSQYVDEKSTIMVYWTNQVPTTLLQEIEFDPSTYTEGIEAYPSSVTLEKVYDGSSVLKLRLYLEWQ